MAYPTNAVTKHLVGMVLKRHPWAPMKMLQLAMYSKCPKSVTHCHFLLGFHSKNRAPPTKNGSATATITIKPERLAYLCVEQALLYPWMCFTSWFAVSDRGVSVMIAVHLELAYKANNTLYSTGQRQRQNETCSNAFGGQLKRVCVHHAQVMEGTVASV